MLIPCIYLSYAKYKLIIFLVYCCRSLESTQLLTWQVITRMDDEEAWHFTPSEFDAEFDADDGALVRGEAIASVAFQIGQIRYEIYHGYTCHLL